MTYSIRKDSQNRGLAAKLMAPLFAAYLGVAGCSKTSSERPTKKGYAGLKVITNGALTGKGKDFSDPTHSGNPLYKLRESDLERKLSKDFKLKEFCKIPNPQWVPDKYEIKKGGNSYWKYCRVDPEMVKKLQNARDKCGQGIGIVSGYRPKFYNDLVYKKARKRIRKLSRHQAGDAVDPATPRGHPCRDELASEFRKGGIGTGNTKFHVDNRPNKARWKYSIFDVLDTPVGEALKKKGEEIIEGIKEKVPGSLQDLKDAGVGAYERARKAVE